MNQARLEDELSKKVAKFEKRLSETDPVSGAPRYGESMTAKVRRRGTKICFTNRLPPGSTGVTDVGNDNIEPSPLYSEHVSLRVYRWFLQVDVFLHAAC